MKARSSGERQDIAVDPITAQSALTRWTSRPMIKFIAAPTTGAGRKRRDAWIALTFSTYWNTKVRRVSSALNAPQVRKTLMQMLVKTLFRHREFGMRAGRPRRSCLPTQTMKAGINAKPVERSAMMRGSWISAVLPVSVLVSKISLLYTVP